MKKPTTLILAAMSLALVGPAVRAQSSDSDIQALIGQVAAAYRNLTTFSTTLEMTQSAGANEIKITSKMVLKKPAFLSAEVKMGTDVNHVVADGKMIYSDSSRDKTKYIKQPDDKLEDAITALARNRGTGIGLLPILLTSPAAEKQIIPGTPKSLKRLADQKVGSDDCDVIQAVIGAGERTSRFRFAFGKQDHLLRQLTIGPDSEGAKPSITEIYSDVNLQPTLAADTFKYTPAPGAVGTEPPKDPPMYDPRIKVGATPFPIKGQDLAGKPVTLDQFKGRVLLLDFWATWCGPCVGELPNVIAAYNKYHSKGFEIVGISLDQENARPKLEAFIKDHKMPWQQIYDGKYWQAGNAVAYGVQAIPFTLLIGRDGKIAAVGARGPALAPAIEAALAKQEHAAVK